MHRPAETIGSTLLPMMTRLNLFRTGFATLGKPTMLTAQEFDALIHEMRFADDFERTDFRPADFYSALIASPEHSDWEIHVGVLKSPFNDEALLVHWIPNKVPTDAAEMLRRVELALAKDEAAAA